ncbi:hypothetical protein B0F90DRAFT_1722805 [Multifurca ochricompacta]|uniref:Protein MON2 homolog n=1 Tax=Multifurca ochricompacta TaxID=376703 RepID=A0AAD4M4B2_9AGAM|nr:hypothetical protein B0F90DRAFT_1722805 [Multifurca ochricompacta]
MSSLTFLVTELQSLASETRRKHPEVREAAEKSLALLRSSPEQVTANLASDGWHADDLLRPVFMGCATKNAKVITIALGSLQRLITLRAVSLSAIPTIIQTMNDCMSQGVDIQLKILQTLLSLITNFPAIHGRLLANSLLLCFKLHESRTAVVSSTAAATLRQLVMFVVDKVVEEDRRLLLASELESITLPDGTTQTLGPAARDTFVIFEDLCLLGNGERPQFLQLEYLHKTFALELIESVLTNYHELFRKHSELLLLLRHHLCPLLLKTLQSAPVFLTLLIKIVTSEVETADSRPGWMRVLAMEIMRGLCSDAEFMRSVWQRYDAFAVDSDAGGAAASALVFTLLISALKRLVTSRPSLLGVSAQMQGVGVPASDSLPHIHHGHSLDSVAGMVATAASATVSNVVGMIGSEAGLSVQGAAMKVQCIDQLDKADAPPIPEAYIYLLGVQCLVSLSDGLAGYAIPLYNTFAIQKPPAGSTEPVRAPGPLDPSTLPVTEPAREGLLAARAMLNAALARAAGSLALPTPRDAFLTALAKAALPPRVVAALDESPQTPTHLHARSPVTLEGLTLGLAGATSSSTPQAPGLSARNLACLRALVAAALFLAGTLGTSWFAVLEALQNADYVLTTRGTTPSGPPGAGATAAGVEGQQQPQQQRLQAPHPLLADVDSESVQAAIQRLFDASKMLEDAAFRDFVAALCKLSVEMVSMQSGVGVGVGMGAGEGSLEVTEEDGPPSASASSTSLVTPLSDRFSRRRVSGIHIPRTLVPFGDFGIARLGGVAALNIQRLVYRSPDPIRLQAASTLNEVLAIVPRHLSVAPSDLQAAVQRRVLDVLAQQIMLDTTPPGTSSSTSMELRRMGLETLHQILQASGHTLLVGWETIFEVLGSVCRPAAVDPTSLPAPFLSGGDGGGTSRTPRPLPLGYLQEKGYSALIKIAFQCMTLMCDSLAALSPEHLRLCISTLGQFGRQADTNIALTAAESLFWGVSDAIQAKRREAEQEPAYSGLWMHLLLEILRLCTDARPEVRLGAIQTLFRTLQLYGATLSLDTWDECVWKVTFPLLDTLSPSHIRRENVQIYSSTSDSTDTSTSTTMRRADVTAPAQTWPEPMPDPSWDESKVVALQSIGAILNDFLVSKIIHLPSFSKAWETFVTHIRDAFLLDSRTVSAPALRCLERALKAAMATSGADTGDAALLRASLGDIWEKTWTKCEEIGALVVQRASSTSASSATAPFTQESLVAFVDVIKCVRSISRTLEGAEWPLKRISTLMAILKGVLTYPDSPDYRPDVDKLSPVQAIVMNAVDSIELMETGAPSYILRDLSEYATLAFIASFDIPEIPKRGSNPTNAAATQAPPVVTTSSQKKRVTYIALAKMCMPKLADLFLQFKEKEEIFVDETIEAILSAYAIPIKFKYDCPPPSKFGKDPPLWKTATSCFLRIVKEIGPRVDALGSRLSPVRVESIWRQVIDVYRSGILADCSVADNFSLLEQEEEENFDQSLITSLETDAVPCLGEDRVPDYLIAQVAKVLHQGSQLLQHESEEDYPPTPTSLMPPDGRSDSKVEHEEVGSTVSLSAVSRERFSYWCLDLLFFICSDTAIDREASRRRIAALSLPALIGRCRTTLAGYVADEKLRGNLPFPRVREEELLYVLHKLRELRLWPGSLWAALSESPSKYATEQPAIDTSLQPSELIADSVKRSPRAHVIHFYTLLCEIASTPRKAPSAWVSADRLVTSGGAAPTSKDSETATAVRVLAGGRIEVGRELGVPR